MGTARDPSAVKYFVALLSSDETLLTEVEKDLTAIAGTVEMRSATFAWTFSSFYSNEMGTDLLRRYVSFSTLASPENLAAVKCATQSIEEQYKNDVGGRRVNLDPGYLDLFKLVLASTKNAGQRIYLSQGIYAEVTLLFYNATFHGLEYTYSDYLIPETLEFFSALRGRYVAQLKRFV